MLLLLTLACATSPEVAAEATDTGWPDPTDYDCPEGGTALTWDNFGRQFFVDLCESCHNWESPDPGVPEGLVFDNEEIAWEYQERILLRMGFADQFKVPELPPEDPELYQDLLLREDTFERVALMNQLKEWLSCGRPSWE